jgi:ligand-binding sensor domain-containing protein
MKSIFFTLLILSATLTNAQQWEQIKSLNNIRKIAVAENGEIWSTTLSGIIHFNGDIPILYDSINTTSLLNAFWINDMEFDYDGNIWVATTQGFGKFNGTDWEGLYYPPRLGSANIKDIEIGWDNSVWFGMSALNDREGLSKFDGKNWQTWGEADGLVNRNINTVAIDSADNTIWIGTSRGISVLDGNSFTTYTKDNGLIANDVKVIKIDIYGNKWIGTSNGLSVFDGTKEL